MPLLFPFILVIVFYILSPTKLDVEVAEYICHDKKGLYEIKMAAAKGKTVVCKDNTRHNPNGVLIPVDWNKGG